jgi:(S)-2-hydroxyglutarate dehydrogenase
MQNSADFIIIGGGIVGLTIARELRTRHPSASITLLEKESAIAMHGSGRNSGVLHSGFYYTADSLKAKFCRDGNAAMRAYCAEHNLKTNPCQKLVVAVNEKEVEGLRELKRRGNANGVKVELIDEAQARSIEPRVRTHTLALHSPNTVTVDPVEVSHHIRGQLEAAGVRIITGVAYQHRIAGNRIMAGGEIYEAGMLINAAGLYADKIARDFGFCADYTILPFKGIYLKYKGDDKPLRTNIYPVPNLKNPFLGVHFTITAYGEVKIGPTAIPAFWRENYKGLSNFNPLEMADIVRWQALLFARNAFDFRRLAFEEMRKYSRRHLVNLAMNMVTGVDPDKFTIWSTPGIRAQLLNKKTFALVQDFAVEGDAKSQHVLNAISPAFTCSIPFAASIGDRIETATAA